MHYNFLSVYAIDTFEPIAKWLTISLIAVLLISMLICFFIKRENFSKLSKISLIIFLVYTLVLGAVMLVLEILKKYNSNYLEKNWVNEKVVSMVLLPLLITVFFSLISAVVVFILSKKNSPKLKNVSIVLVAICALSLITALVLIAVYYSSFIKGDGYYTGNEPGKLNSLALYVFAGIFTVLAVVFAIVFARKDDKPFDTKAIAVAGICASLSFALSYIKLWDMPFGGSVTLVSWLPISLFAYIYGTKKGILVGFLYGILQSVQDPYIIHPAQFLIDYPLAFSMVGFAGALKYVKIFENTPQIKFAISTILAGSLRFFCHVLSGVFAFGAYAIDAEATNFWAYSLVYNSYVFIDIALVVIAGAIIFSSKSFRHEVEKLNK